MPRYADFDPTRCLNCGATFPSETRYCPACGQRNRTHKRSIVEWATEGLSTFLHLEGRTWNTVRDIWVPGRLARRYLDGQRQRYLHPLRLLLFGSLFCFTAAQFVPDDSESSQASSQARADLEAALGSASAPPADVEDYEEYIDGIGDDIDDAVEGHRAIRSAREVLARAPLDSVERERLLSEVAEAEAELAEERREHVFGVTKSSPYLEPMRQIDRVRMQFATHERIGALADSAARLRYATTPEAAALLDSFRQAFPAPTGSLGPDTIFGEAAGVGMGMYARLTPEQLVDSSRLERWYNRLILRKAAQLAQEGQDSLNAYLLAQVSWAVLIFVPLLAFGYWVLYRKRLPFYSQHLSLVAVNAGFGLILFGLANLVFAATLAEWIFPLCAFGLIAYVLVAEMRVYEYSWWKTLLKSFALLSYGSIALGIAVVIWLALAVLLH